MSASSRDHVEVGRGPLRSAGRGASSVSGKLRPLSGAAVPFDSTLVTRSSASRCGRRLDDEADPTLVDADVVTGSELRDDLGQRAFDLRRVGRSLRPTRRRDGPRRRRDTHVARTSRDSAGARTRALEVDQHPAGRPLAAAARLALRGHRDPLLGRVVRAVDPHDVGPALDQLVHERGSPRPRRPAA